MITPAAEGTVHPQAPTGNIVNISTGLNTEEAEGSGLYPKEGDLASTAAPAADPEETHTEPGSREEHETAGREEEERTEGGGKVESVKSVSE